MNQVYKFGKYKVTATMENGNGVTIELDAFGFGMAISECEKHIYMQPNPIINNDTKVVKSYI